MGQWIIGSDGETVAMRRKLKPTHVDLRFRRRANAKLIMKARLELGSLPMFVLPE